MRLPPKAIRAKIRKFTGEQIRSHRILAVCRKYNILTAWGDHQRDAGGAVFTRKGHAYNGGELVSVLLVRFVASVSLSMITFSEYPRGLEYMVSQFSDVLQLNFEVILRILLCYFVFEFGITYDQLSL